MFRQSHHASGAVGTSPESTNRKFKPREVITKVLRPRRLTFEDGPLADWLARELRSAVDELVVCEPRRNSWIARDGDKDDPIDARKLADLYRGGYLKPVNQSESLGRSLLKQQVSLYHDRVKERVRQGNQLVALFRRQGVIVKATHTLQDETWKLCRKQLPKGSIPLDNPSSLRSLPLPPFAPGPGPRTPQQPHEPTRRVPQESYRAVVSTAQ